MFHLNLNYVTDSVNNLFLVETLDSVFLEAR